MLRRWLGKSSIRGEDKIEITGNDHSFDIHIQQSKKKTDVGRVANTKDIKERRKTPGSQINEKKIVYETKRKKR